MKKHLLRMSILVLSLFLAINAFSQHSLQTLEVKVPYISDSKMTIDGIANESIWSKAPEMVLSNYLQGTNITPEDLSAKAKVVWSDSALYVSMTVMDDSLTLWNDFKDKPGFDNKHGKVDAIDMHIEIPMEWNIPLGDPSTGDYSDGTYYIRHKVLTPNDYTGNARGSYTAEGYEVIKYMFVKIPGGYTFEAKYPYTLLFGKTKVKPEDLMKAERTIGMEIMIADADGVPTDTRLAWNQNNGYTAWQYKDAFGRVKLGSIPRHTLQTLEVTVPYVSDSKMTIDGEAKESIWSKAPEMVLLNYLQGTNMTPEDLSATAKVVWSDSALYVSMVVKDDSLTLWNDFKDKPGFDNRHGRVDAVDMHIEIPMEWNIPLGDPSTGDYSDGTYYIRHKVLTPNDYTGNARGSYTAEGYEVIKYMFVKTPGGYTFEAKYPYSLLFGKTKVKPEDLMKAERTIGMEIMLADADGAPLDARLAWNQNYGYTAWQYKDAFGRVKLGSIPRHTLQTLEVTAPYVSDSKMTIDGEAKESIWSKAKEMVLLNYLQGTNMTPEDLSATAKVLWSDSALYVSMMVKDDSLTLWNDFKDKPGFDNRHGRVDAVDMHIEIPMEWNIPLGDPSTGDYSDGTYYIRHKVLTPNDYTGNARGSYTAEGYEAIKYMFVKVPGGYTFEAKYPYSLLFSKVKVKPEDLMKAERTIGMEIMLADADGAPLDARLAWNQNYGYTAWQYKDAFGRVKLGSIPKHTLQTLEVRAPFESDSKMTVDGEAKESIWSKANEMVLLNYLQGTNMTPEDLSATAKVVWTDSALYVAMNVKDDSLTLWNDFKDKPGFDNRHGRVDAVDMHIEIPMEWNIPLGDPSTGDYSDGTYYIRHKVLTPNDYTGNARGSYTAEGYEAIKYMFVKKPGGYSFEARYPYKLLFSKTKVKPEDLLKAERTIGMEIMIADADGAPLDARLAWNQNYGYTAWQYKDAFGRVVLGKSVKVGINELTDINSLNVYPNPVQDKLNITCGTGISEVYISNIAGQTVKSLVRVNNQHITLDASDLNTGIYMISVIDNNDARYVRKIIVK